MRDLSWRVETRGGMLLAATRRHAVDRGRVGRGKQDDAFSIPGAAVRSDVVAPSSANVCTARRRSRSVSISGRRKIQSTGCQATRMDTSRFLFLDGLCRLRLQPPKPELSFSLVVAGEHDSAPIG